MKIMCSFVMRVEGPAEGPIRRRIDSHEGNRVKNWGIGEGHRENEITVACCKTYRAVPLLYNAR